jgi:phospholipid/cholesterol/gamma-HCH transport system substrate-binding protein
MSKLSTEAKVGVFFLAGLAIFAYVWFKVLDLGFFKEAFLLKARFKSVEGLVPDAQVQIAGMKVGKVKSIRFDAESGKVLVTMEISDAYKNAIPEGSRITFKTKGLLGDKYIVIEPGKPNAPKLKPGEEIEQTYEPVDQEKVFESVAAVAQDMQILTREARKQLIDEKGSEKVARIIDSTDVAAKHLKELLVRNHEKIDRAIDNADDAAKDVRDITGRNKEKINRTVDDMEKFSKSMDKTSERFGRVAADLENTTKEIRQGRGTLGKLVTDDSLHRDAQNLVRSLQGITNRVQSGSGTIGMLVNDPEMYFEARRALRNMNKAAEDVSDATPISTLATILGAVLK